MATEGLERWPWCVRAFCCAVVVVSLLFGSGVLVQRLLLKSFLFGVLNVAVMVSELFVLTVGKDSNVTYLEYDCKLKLDAVKRSPLTSWTFRRVFPQGHMGGWSPKLLPGLLHVGPPAQ